MLTTREARARDAGFEALERDEWVTIVEPDDPDLRFETLRSPEPGPWL